MATTSEVKAGLNAIAGAIATSRNKVNGAIIRLEEARTDLQSIPTAYVDVRTTIQAFTPTGEMESLAQDELNKLTTEFTTLVSDITNAITALGG